MDIPFSNTNRLSQFLVSRRGRRWREYLTAYILVGPALLLIFVFGIFPVGFALYVSLHKWLIIRGDLRGLKNYVDMIGSLAYFGAFVLGIGGIVGAVLLVRRAALRSQEEGTRPWPLLIPAAVHAAVVLTFLRWIYFQLPEFLDIAPKMRGLERTRALFMQLLSDAFHAETVFPAWQLFVRVLLLSLVLAIGAELLFRMKNNFRYQVNLSLAWLALTVGVGLLAFTFSSVSDAYAAAVVSGEDPGIWPQLISITAGVLLLGLAWLIWRSAQGESSNRRFAVRIFSACVLMVGAVLLVIEIPTIVASGDPNLWNGLKVTVFFSAGTVPVQLTIALFLSVLLFQRIHGASVFRMIYFLPYVTPQVASATIFRLMFSDRQQAPINKLLSLVGIGAQRWLREPKGIVTMLLDKLGAPGYPASILPSWLPHDLSTLLADWLPGPSQALVVVIMLSVWTYVGYNVVIYLAGLGNIPSELTEAAEIDGANKWDVFRHITFPLLSPTTYFLSLIAVIGTFKVFNILWLLRQSVGSGVGSLNTIGVVIFEEFFIKTRYGYASAMAFVLFAIILGLTLVNNRVQGSRVFYG